MSSLKIRVNYKLAPEIERLLKQRTIVLDDGGLSRNISHTLQPLRNRGKLLVGHDRARGKSILRIEGISDHRRSKRTGSSVFEMFLE
jgi:hypothetical protein